MRDLLFPTPCLRRVVPQLRQELLAEAERFASMGHVELSRAGYGQAQCFDAAEVADLCRMALELMDARDAKP